MMTLQETPEINWRQVYGVLWDGEAKIPYVEYEDWDEACKMAVASGGRVVVRYIGMTEWLPVIQRD